MCSLALSPKIWQFLKAGIYSIPYHTLKNKAENFADYKISQTFFKLLVPVGIWRMPSPSKVQNVNNDVSKDSLIGYVIIFVLLFFYLYYFFFFFVENLPKTLSEFHVGNSARLKADDFLQNYQLVLNIQHRSVDKA